MLARLFLNWVILAVAVGIAAATLPGIEVHGGIGTILWIALLFGLVNVLLGPILHLLALPITVLTLGLFALVVNGVLLAATAGLSSKLDIDNFGTAILGALIISIVVAVLQLITRSRVRQA
ncbi:MAG TPA: phage holin family protein [Jatrophihabitans sp.]|nr:phage holin family protein [Jatrophihabitans sp.]